MRLTLKVLDQKRKEPININVDERWNANIKFEIPESLLLSFIEELIDNMLDSSNLNDIISIKNDLSDNEINAYTRSTRSWKKISAIIQDKDFQTSRFTRISLFKALMDTKSIKQKIDNKISDIEQNNLKNLSVSTSDFAASSPIN
jgi:hypothetical protein